MELTKQVCSLELAKKLEKLGVKQESMWYWYDCYDDMAVLNRDERYVVGGVGRYHYKYSAFTCAELGEMLPRDLYIPYKGNSGKKRKYPQHPHCFFGDFGSDWSYHINYTGGNSQEYIEQHAKSEANARAKMLIYLIENKLINL